MTTSHWRLAARQVIRRVLDGLPANVTEAQARAALNREYPFGTREHHPYRCWLAEVRLALGKASRKSRAASGEVCYTVTATLGVRPWWLAVRCDWCDGEKAGGCMMCTRHRLNVAELTATEDFRNWRAAMVREPANAPLVFADWLDDRDQAEVAAAFRAAVQS
jgi:hypothetical protein